MIRINLLPVRAVKKREAGRQLLVLFAAVLGAVIVGNFFWYNARANVRNENKDKITTYKKKIADLEKVIGEVNNISKRKQEVEEKLKILEQLKKGRTGPVKMMDALSTATPKKVWLRTFDEQSGGVKIEGTAISNDDIAEFIHDLEHVVWTPQGIGRLVEQKRDAATSRVELLASGGAIQDFRVSDVAAFFSNVELKTATQKTIDSSAPGATGNIVDFELSLTANYSI